MKKKLQKRNLPLNNHSKKSSMSSMVDSARLISEGSQQFTKTLDRAEQAMNVANSIIDDTVLEKVAKIEWEKEVVTKYQKSYVTTFATHTSLNMYHIKASDRVDDDNLTPRAEESCSQLVAADTKFENVAHADLNE